MQFVQFGQEQHAVDSAPRVLVIDDEPAIRRAVRRFLANKGCAVTEAEDGNQGLALLAEKPYDVIICDIDLPGSDGATVWKSTLASQPEMAGRFLFVSALPLPLEIGRAFAPYLPKPFELAALWHEVQRILGGEPRQAQDRQSPRHLKD